ncbi:MAG: 2-phospho-L-lactate transferase [Acidobacteriota bacterium]|nr:2-phospho-L-lactate transferase [Acidobacteriota bacterium]
MISVLSGGVGAARLLAALRANLPDLELEAIVNVGDDLVLHGLTICPDLDTITYTLAGLNNEVTGWGLTGETWRVMDELAALGGEAWFRLGDRDLATHLYRSQRLAQGATKSEIARELAERHGVGVRLLPVSDDPLATVLDTEVGVLSFQEYFVARRHDVAVRAIRVEGAADAAAAPGVLASLDTATRIVIAPSNPLLSIEPILAVAAVRERVAARRSDVIAVSPIVGGAALKGPADRLLAEMGYPATCVGVAQYYRGLVGTLVIDDVDAAHADAVRDLGMECVVTTTVMENPAHAAQLARVVVS